MHDTAFEIGRAFLSIYGGPGIAILDVGSQDVNGSLRSCAPPGSTYLGVDMSAGEGVDMTLTDSHALPFNNGQFDIVLSTSCLEHDPMFWLTFLEMARVTKFGGYIYLNVPSNGDYHRFPTDNWRFYPDAGLALQTWASHEGQTVSLVESFVARRKKEGWNDTVLVFSRGAARPAGSFLCDAVPNAMNLRKRSEPDEILSYFPATEDKQVIDGLAQTVVTAYKRIAELEQTVSRYEEAMKRLGIPKPAAGPI
jgi:SAM-dependent methyltransferase